LTNHEFRQHDNQQPSARTSSRVLLSGSGIVVVTLQAPKQPLPDFWFNIAAKKDKPVVRHAQGCIVVAQAA
jgi:hypothetical protein